jgi:isopenicillin N synthase-like dioxygenase
MAIGTLHEGTSSCLPIIDISTFISPFCSREERQKAADEINQVSVDVGFFYVTGYGISDSNLNRILREYLSPQQNKTIQDGARVRGKCVDCPHKIQALGKMLVHAICSALNLKKEVFVRCGTHTDFGYVTLLSADPTVGNLQVLTKDGQLIKANPIPGAFVVSIGNVIEHCTNGLWKNTRCRVIHKGDGYQLSVPLFYEQN